MLKEPCSKIKFKKPINIWLCGYNSSKSWEDLHFSSQNIEVLYSGILHPGMSAFTVNNQGPGKGMPHCWTHYFNRPPPTNLDCFSLGGSLKKFDYWNNNKHWWGSEGSSGKLLPVISPNEQRETKIKHNGESCTVLVSTGAALSTLNPIFIKQQICWSKENISIVGVSYEILDCV